MAETRNGAKDGVVEPEPETSTAKDKGKARERNESKTAKPAIPTTILLMRNQ